VAKPLSDRVIHVPKSAWTLLPPAEGLCWASAVLATHARRIEGSQAEPVISE
jgi:hypothetical protein